MTDAKAGQFHRHCADEQLHTLMLRFNLKGGFGSFMQLETGTVVDGKITGITRFGAFVDLGDGTTGMVHISEISSEYVNEISDYVKEGETVRVKVLHVENNKIALSIKQANPNKASGAPSFAHTDGQRPKKNPRRGREVQVYRGLPKREKPQTFEDMLARFKQNSEEKMSDIKRNMDGKRGSYSRKH